MQFMSIRSDLCRYVGTPGTLSINFLIWDGGSIYDERRMVLSRFSSGLFRAMFAMKEIENGKEIHRRVSA